VGSSLGRRRARHPGLEPGIAGCWRPVFAPTRRRVGLAPHADHREPETTRGRDKRVRKAPVSKTGAPTRTRNLGDQEGAPRTLFVDKDRVQCPEAEFQSITEAVIAAPPESTIMVCPDLYPEDVPVFKELTVMKQHRGSGLQRLTVGLSGTGSSGLGRPAALESVKLPVSKTGDSSSRHAARRRKRR
jgi:hypothetical protein